MRFLVTLVCFMFGWLNVAQAFDFTAKAPQKLAVKEEKSDKLVIGLNNVIIARGMVDDKSVAKWTQQLYKTTSDEVIVYLDTPGGSVVAGMKFVDALRNSGKTITCVASFAASMGFVIFQACHNRVVKESSILMQHQPSWGTQGAPQANNLQFVKFLTRMTEIVDLAQAKRLGVDVKKFQAMVHDDMWLYGADAVTTKAADSVGSVVCTPDLLNKSYVEEVQVFIFTFKLTWSMCPLVDYPLNIEMPGGTTDKAKGELDRYVNFPRNDGTFIKNLNANVNLP